jgi:ribose transport system permease protein
VSEVAGAARSPRLGSLRQQLDHFLIESNGAIFIALLVLIAFFTIASPNQAFLSPFGVRSMVLAGSSILVVAVGATFVLIAGQIDLSIGAVLVLAGVIGIDVMTRLVEASLGDVAAIALGCVVVLAVGAAAGLVNGLLTTRLRIPSFIVTLGTLGIAMGMAQLISVGPLSLQVPKLMNETIGFGSLFGIPWPVVIAVTIALFAWLVLSQTRVGLATYAVGSNREAARRAGVPVNRLLVTVFIVMGLCASVAAIIDMSRFTTVPIAGYSNTALAAIAAVIIGGTSLFGGRGSIPGTVIGVMIPVVLLSGLVILGVDPFWQNIVIGAMLIVAVGFDQFQRERIARGLDSSGPPAEPPPPPRLPESETPHGGDTLRKADQAASTQEGIG